MDITKSVMTKRTSSTTSETIKFALIIIFISLSVNLFAQPFFPIRLNKLWGAIDSTGKVVLKPAYDNLYVFGENNNFITAQLGDSTFLINSRIQIVARTVYAAIIENGDGMFMTRLRSKIYYPSFFGLMDSTGKVILEPVFCLMERFNNGVAKVNIHIDTTGNYKEENERSGIIDRMGNWIIKPAFKTYHIKSSSDSLINFYIEKKGWGAMDATNKVIIEPKYNWLGPYKYGYMEYGISKHGIGLMKKDEIVTIPDDGKKMISYRPHTQYDTLVIVHQLEFVKDDILPYRYIDGKIYTVNGEFLYEAKYGKECSHQCHGFFEVSNSEMKRGMMNSSGKIVVEPIYDVLQWFQPGLKQVEKNRKWGFIDDYGSEIIPCIYDDSKPFNNGLAAIYVGGTWFDYISPEKYPNVRMGYINRKGEIIWEPSW
jgi:hypothetical protein